jgi:hypothetical protein
MPRKESSISFNNHFASDRGGAAFGRCDAAARLSASTFATSAASRSYRCVRTWSPSAGSSGQRGDFGVGQIERPDRLPAIERCNVLL